MSELEASELNLYEFTTTTDEGGERIVSVAGRIADHRESDKQQEWISFQFSIDLPTFRNGALQRQAALKKVHDIGLQLAKHFEKIGRER